VPVYAITTFNITAEIKDITNTGMKKITTKKIAMIVFINYN